jgi:hypothetical protein
MRQFRYAPVSGMDQRSGGPTCAEPGVQGLRHLVEEAQPDLVADGELLLAMIGVVVLLGELLRLE